MASRDEWDACVDHLYDSVGTEDRLTAALGRFRPFLGSSAVVFATTPDPRTQQSRLLTGAVGLPTAAWVEYVGHFNVYDEWVKAGLARNMEFPGGVVRGSELVPQHELRRSYFWREWLARYNVGDIISAVIEPLAPDSPSSFVTFQRRDEQPQFSDADVVTLTALAPHLRRALRLHRRLAPQLAIGSTLMQLFLAAEAPMLLIARDSTINHQNPASQAAMSEPAALIALRCGRLHYASAQGWQDLDTTLERFETGEEPAFEIALGADEGRSASLEVRRVHGAFSDRLAIHEAVAVCTLRLRSANFAAAFRKHHRLTATEWRVVLYLAEGLTPAQTAEAMGVRLTTVRTHIRSALTKTDSQRQTQLVAKILKACSTSGNRNPIAL